MIKPKKILLYIPNDADMISFTVSRVITDENGNAQHQMVVSCCNADAMAHDCITGNSFTYDEEAEDWVVMDKPELPEEKEKENLKNI